MKIKGLPFIDNKITTYFFSLANLITQKDYKIYTLNEFGIFPPYSSIDINSKVEKTREYITKRILESYIFLSNYSHEVLEEITNSFLYDTFLDIPHHICKYQDFKIMLINDDYTNIKIITD